MEFERTQTWTFEEVKALDLAIEKYGKNWELIIKEFGQEGKGLEDKATKIKLYQKARARALELFQKDLYSPQSKIYHVIIKPENFLKLLNKGSLVRKKKSPNEKKVKEQKVTVASSPKKQKTEWTEDEDNKLISAYNEFRKLQMESGKRFSIYEKIVEKHPELKDRHKDMVLRDRVGLLQSRIVKRGEFVEFPARRSWLDYKKWLFNDKCQQFVYCFKEVTSGCGRIITERELMTTGLSCKCGKGYLELAKYTKKYPHITYIISEKGKSLTEEVLYVGYTTNLSERLQVHKRNFLKDKEYTVRITTRLSEQTALRIFKGIKNYSNNTKCFYTIKDNLIEKLNNLQEPNLKFLYEIPLEPDYCYHSKSGDLITKPTLNFELLKSRQSKSWCYIRNPNKQIQEHCECVIKCPIRSIVNQWKGLEKYYPLNLEQLSKSWIKEDSKIDYSIGIAERSKEFLLSCIKRKTNLKDASIKNYTSIISNLCDKSGLLESITDFKKILECIYKNSKGDSLLEKRLSMIPIIYNTLTPIEQETVFGTNHSEIYNTLYTKFIQLKNQRDTEKQNGQKSKKQEENWIEYDEMVNKFKEYKQIPEITDGVKYDTYLAIKLHLFQATIRNDYRTVKLFDYDTELDNYIDWNTKEFVFNNYKTHETYGKIKTPIKKDVIDDIEKVRKYRLQNKHMYLLNSENNTEITSSTYSLRIGKQMEKIYNKHITPTTMRNIYTSFIRKDELPLETSKKLAMDMHHSESTSRSVYRKI